MWILYVRDMCIIREAVRQRKALSRTSSNILLNSVQPYNYQPINNRLKLQAPRFSDCDEHNLTIKESQQESHSEVSELEVSVSQCQRNPITILNIIIIIIIVYQWINDDVCVCVCVWIYMFVCNVKAKSDYSHALRKKNEHAKSITKNPAIKSTNNDAIHNVHMCMKLSELSRIGWYDMLNLMKKIHTNQIKNRKNRFEAFHSQNFIKLSADF